MVFLSKIIKDVRDELKNIGFLYNGEINVFKMNNDKVLIHFVGEDSQYFIEYSEKGLLKEKYENKRLLEKNGISTGVVAGDNKIIVYIDYVYSDDYRAIDEEDFKDEHFVRLLARWYKKFHSIKGLIGEIYSDYFKLENIRKVKEKYNLIKNNFVEYVENHFDNISLKFKRTQSCFVLSKFAMKNLVVSKKNKELVIVDFDKLYEGNRAMDIAAVCEFFNEEMQMVFLNEYGEVKEEEFIFNEIVMSFVELFLSVEKEFNNPKVKYYLNSISNEKLYEKAKVLVNWY